MTEITNDDCALCDGCGEIETTSRTTSDRETVPCPECIAREIAAERTEHAAEVLALRAEVERLREAGTFADGIEAAAKIVRGQVYKECYRTWPEYGTGNRSNDDEIVRMCDALADAILVLVQPSSQKEGD